MSYLVTLESDDHGTTAPVDSLSLSALDRKDAARKAARTWGLKPWQWCFEHSPFRIQATEEER
jgi:hypothetical protein